MILALFGYTPYPDSNGYIDLAKECIEQQDIYPITSELNHYHFLWNIGAINAVVFSLYLFHSVIPLLILYALMKGTTAWLFYQITKHISNERIALIALILFMLYPANYGECTSTLSELPFMFFIIIGIYLCLNKKYYILGGMAIAIANWFRPMGIVFLIAILIYLFILHIRTFRPLIGYILIICIIGGLSIHRTGLFLYQAKTGWMALTDYSTNHSTESLKVLENKDWNVSQKDSAWQSLFYEWIKDHPTEYVKQMPTKLVNTYVSDNVNMCSFIPNKTNKAYMYEEVSMQTIIASFPIFSAVQWLTILNIIIYLCIIVTAFCSLYFYNNKYLLPVSIIVLGTLVLLFVGHGEARFHIPFMPFFIMLSALFINKKIWKG